MLRVLIMAMAFFVIGCQSASKREPVYDVKVEELGVGEEVQNRAESMALTRAQETCQQKRGRFRESFRQVVRVTKVTGEAALNDPDHPFMEGSGKEYSKTTRVSRVKSTSQIAIENTRRLTPELEKKIEELQANLPKLTKIPTGGEPGDQGAIVSLYFQCL